MAFIWYMLYLFTIPPIFNAIVPLLHIFVILYRPLYCGPYFYEDFFLSITLSLTLYTGRTLLYFYASYLYSFLSDFSDVSIPNLFCV